MFPLSLSAIPYHCAHTYHHFIYVYRKMPMNRLYQWHTRGKCSWKCSYAQAELALIHHAMTESGDGEKINAVNETPFERLLFQYLCSGGWVGSMSYVWRPPSHLPSSALRLQRRNRRTLACG